MINIDLLDKTKTYVGWQVGAGFVAHAIQGLSTKEAQGLSADKIASHCFMLVYLGEWYIFEAHLKWGGCKKLPFSNWIKDYKQDEIFCAQRELNIDDLEFYANPKFNPGYSVAQITHDALNELTDKHIFNDCPGMVCSEYFAICDKGKKTCYKYGLHTYEVKPVHLQMEEINNVLIF